MHEQLNTGEPNIQLLVGDNMYTTENPPSKGHYWFKYFQQRAVPEFTNVFRAFAQTPGFALVRMDMAGVGDSDGV